MGTSGSFFPEPFYLLGYSRIVVCGLTLFGELVGSNGRVAGLAAFGCFTDYLINNLRGSLFAAVFGLPLRGYTGPSFSTTGQRVFE